MNMRTLLACAMVLGALSTHAGDSPAQKRAKEIIAEQPPPPKLSTKTVITNSPATNSANTNLLTPPADFGSKAYYTARKAVESALKSPRSAKFSNPSSDPGTGWQPYGYFQWKVGGTVDAKNPLGVELRESWAAVVQYNVGMFEVVYLKVGDQVSGKMPAIRRAPGS